MIDLIIMNLLSILECTFLATEFGFLLLIEFLEESTSLEVFSEVIDLSVSEISDPTSDGEALLVVLILALASSKRVVSF